MPLKLFLIEQFAVDGYDTYDSAVVAAADVESARRIHPGQHCEWSAFTGNGCWISRRDGEPARIDDWAPHIDSVSVRCIGDAVDGTEPGVILASFNAG